MGPFVAPRVKADWEKNPIHQGLVEQIFQMQQDNVLSAVTTNRLHSGRWTREGTERYAYVRCTGPTAMGDCDWRSEGPPGDQGGRSNPHIIQWQRHRAEMAVREGVEIVRRWARY